MSSEKREALVGLFEVKPAQKSFRRAVPRRIESIRPFKAVDNDQANWMKGEAYDAAGLEEYIPCWTGEMAQRPIPFVSRDEKPLRTQQVFAKYIGAVLQFLAPDITPAIQPFNKISALGFPIVANPGDGIDKKPGSSTLGSKIYQSKFDVILDAFQLMQRGDFDIYADGFHTIGCRKQNEPPDKKRVFQFVSDDGSVFEQEISRLDRLIKVPQLGAMVGSRTRTIVRPPVVNLWLQCWDTLLHNAIKRHPLFDSNVYNKVVWPADSNFVTFDCKHYERYLGLCALTYADTIGGRYGEQLTQLIKYPFIVPSNTWKSFHELRPLFRPGVYPQFSSGLSPVAPLGKLCNICVQVAYFVEVQHQDLRSAIATVFSGSSDGMRRWCFGDDNRILGPAAQVDEFCAFMGQYFEIEFDEIKRYLGTVFRPDIGRWMLPAETYNLKLYQPERDYEWKDYPNLGMVERRAVFTEFGEPEIARTIIPLEDELWNAVGHPFVEIASAAFAERVVASRRGVHLDNALLTDKEYLMSEDDKIKSGLYWHLSPAVTATIVNSLVGREVRQLLTFKNATPTPVPTSDRRVGAFQQDTSESADEADPVEEITYA